MTRTGTATAHGTTTTPFDTVMLNDLDRFHLARNAIDRVPTNAPLAARLRRYLSDQCLDVHAYTRRPGEDRPDIRDRTWKH